MYFTKYPHPANFTFATRFLGGEFELDGRLLAVETTSFEGGVHHIRVRGDWGPNRCLVPLIPPPATTNDSAMITPEAGLDVSGRGSPNRLRGSGVESRHFFGPEREFFGISGAASLFQFEVPPETRFYGMGEKAFGRVELSQTRAKFWNTDVMGDFHPGQWRDHACDPSYFSTPYVLLRAGGSYLGLLLDNPYPSWIATPDVTDPKKTRHPSWKKEDEPSKPPRLILGSEGGEPNLWIIEGPSIGEVTRKLQKLIGVAPLPPLWALGYQQSRWGYRGHDDLVEIDKRFEDLGIPCSALWMDLEYMRGFRVFDTSKDAFPGGAKETAAILAKNHRRIVPILDPGVKQEPGYHVYDDGLANDVFCRNAEGKPFVGLVWPGETVFPDFTLEHAREWWAGYVAGFREEGFGGTWIDMNDPSTGAVDPTGMRFRNGNEPHEPYHNQYALGMHMATYAGFVRARPDERPFILSRSGFTGSSRFGAVWTGDNISNRFYLRNSIPAAIGMSLSGMPFNGPDLGGFGGNTDDALMSDWVKTDFLFPFFRNHSAIGTRRQEPWQFKPTTLRVMRHYIRLRYRLLPYLYNLFIEQEESGDPSLRPMFYHFGDEGLDSIDDQFMVGPFILQAPHVGEERLRDMLLPGGEPWFDAIDGSWAAPGAHRRARTAMSSPLFFANGAIVPMRRTDSADNRTDLRRIEFHIFASADTQGSSRYVYRADDGISFGYRRGERSRIEVEAKWKQGRLEINWSQTANGYGPIRPRFTAYGATEVTVNGKEALLTPRRIRLTGRPFMGLAVS